MIDEKTIYTIVDKAKKYDELVKFPHKEREVSCSFCGKSQGLVKKIILGPGSITICDECVGLCVEIIDEKDVNGECLK